MQITCLEKYMIIITMFICTIHGNYMHLKYNHLHFIRTFVKRMVAMKRIKHMRTSSGFLNSIPMLTGLKETLWLSSISPKCVVWLIWLLSSVHLSLCSDIRANVSKRKLPFVIIVTRWLACALVRPDTCFVNHPNTL